MACLAGHPASPLPETPDRPPAEPAPAAPAHTIPESLGWQQILLLIWAAGAAVTLGVIAVGNLKLALFLQKNRRPLGTSGKRRVYAVAGLGSSCLFGNSIYVTGEALTDETLRRYVLAHENSHARHGDFAWSVLRCLALVIHWFNPLVWQAADLSRRDAEAFADAGALRELGENERQAYGLALIRLYAGRSSGVSLAVTASTMTGGKKTLTERITRIASRPRLTAAAAVALVCLVVLSAACSFGGTKETVSSGNRPAATEGNHMTGQKTGELSGWAGTPVELSDEDRNTIEGLTKDWIAENARDGDIYYLYQVMPLTVYDNVFYALKEDKIAEMTGGFHDQSWDEDVYSTYCWFFQMNTKGEWCMIDVPPEDRETVMQTIKEVLRPETNQYRNLIVRWPLRDRDLSSITRKEYSVHDDWLVAEGDYYTGEGNWQYWSCLLHRGEDGIWKTVDE